MSKVSNVKIITSIGFSVVLIALVTWNCLRTNMLLFKLTMVYRYPFSILSLFLFLICITRTTIINVNEIKINTGTKGSYKNLTRIKIPGGSKDNLGKIFIA